MKHPTRQAINKFNKILGLREDPTMQDWEIECADPRRVGEFIECYKKHASSEDERFTLMALILGSFEEYHGLESPDIETWAKINDILCNERELHADHIEYYSCSDTENKEEWFPITHLIRSV